MLIEKSNNKHEYNYIIEREGEGWFVGSVPELRGYHSQAKSLDELAVRMKEVIALCLEDAEDSEPLEFIGFQKVDV